MLFDILSSVAETAKDKVIETKDKYDKDYEFISKKTAYWDDEKLKNEYERFVKSGSSDFAKKAAWIKVLQDRGLTNN